MNNIRFIGVVLTIIIVSNVFVACSNDNDNVEDEITTVKIDENGKASGNVKFVQIDEHNFYINDIKYTITQGHLAVTGYDIGFSGHAEILSEIEYRGAKLNVLEIDADAFYNCSALTSISIPECVIEIGDHAFGKTSLKEITIPKNVKKLWDGVIPETLTSITIGSTETIISEYALSAPEILDIKFLSGEKLSGCLLYGNVNKIIFPNSLKEIGWLHLKYIKNFELPKTVIKINSLYFEDSPITSFPIPENVKEIGELCFGSCSSLTEVSIPESVQKIDKLRFYNCASLKSFVIPNCVSSICDNAFESCNSLNSITIPTSVTSIGNYAFEWCSGLTSITIPSSVTTIGDHAFYGCASLIFVISLRETPCNIGEYTFCEINDNATLYVPVGSRNNYVNNNNWKKYFKRIVEGTPDNIY